MLRRKIANHLLEWKEDENKKPLIIKGCRQCGKTYSVLEFAKSQYENVAYINFFENNAYASIFSGSLEVENIIMQMSTLLGPEINFVPGKTIIILDEIQDCPEARTALKFFKLDGRYDVIGTASLLGVKGYGEKPVSVPVGYETVVDMHPLDFEEFLWAVGIKQDVVDLLSECLENVQVVPPAIHQKMREVLLQYTVVGGMPEAVNCFVKTKQMNQVLQIQRNLVRNYKEDMVKYADKKDKAFILKCFESIPRQLAKENKKYQYAIVKKGGKASQFGSSLQWIKDAGITQFCRNLCITELPLDGNVEENVFKVYMQDSGLFVSMLEDGTQFDILQGNLFTYKGAIFENLVADIFGKMGRELYYFKKDSGLELDFVIRYKGKCVPVEIKAVNGNAKSAKTVLNHPEKYHVDSVIKLGDYNVGKSESRILTLPIYMAFLLVER